MNPISIRSLSAGQSDWAYLGPTAGPVLNSTLGLEGNLGPQNIRFANLLGTEVVTGQMRQDGVNAATNSRVGVVEEAL